VKSSLIYFSIIHIIRVLPAPGLSMWPLINYTVIIGDQAIGLGRRDNDSHLVEEPGDVHQRLAASVAQPGRCPSGNLLMI
jgi:hypothetical protein